jgi:hypothetical protein
MFISKFFRVCREFRIAGMPIRKKIIANSRKLKFTFTLEMKMEKKRSISEKMELFRAKFVHHFLEFFVKKGLILGSKPDKKNSSKR